MYNKVISLATLLHYLLYAYSVKWLLVPERKIYAPVLTAEAEKLRHPISITAYK
jgi:hypothetical protein